MNIVDRIIIVLDEYFVLTDQLFEIIGHRGWVDCVLVECAARPEVAGYGMPICVIGKPPALVEPPWFFFDRLHPAIGQNARKCGPRDGICELKKTMPRAAKELHTNTTES